MKHFKYFETESAYNTERNGNYIEPWVSWTEDKGVDWNKKKLQPLTFNILSDGEIGWKIGSGSSLRQIYYSRNGGVWLGITSTTSGNTIPVVSGDVLRFKGSVFPGSTYENYSQFTSTCTFAASGNPGSLKYGEVTYGDEPLAKGCYYYLFKDCTGLISAPELPSTTLVDGCYAGMFYGCTNLVSAPELPATTLANNCYSNMFFKCSSLVSAPELPATTLASGCYFNMFNRCSSLVHAPELPATTLTSSCYYQMFLNCGKINEIRCSATDISASSSLYHWLSGVSSTGTFYKATGVTYPSGESGIPSGWTVVDV